MPQIVEVLKYVHEITEREELGVAVGMDVTTHEQKLKILSKDIKVNFDVLLTELRKLLKTNPNFKLQIELIERFLMQLEDFILYPKIFQIPKEKIVQKIVQKDRIVNIPTQDERSIKMELSLSLLVQKLIIQLKRIKNESPSINFQLEDDVKLIFLADLDQGSGLVNADFNAQLKSFVDSVYRKFQSLGSWSISHQIMLNSFLQQRFLMANLVKNANLEVEKAKIISSKSDETIKRFQYEIGILQGFIRKIRAAIINSEVKIEQESIFYNIFRDFDTYTATRVSGEPTKFLGEIEITDARIQSVMRQKEAQILKLRDRIFQIQKSKVNKDYGQSASNIIELLRQQNLKLKNYLSQLQAQLGSVELISDYKKQLERLQERNLQLQQTVSNLTANLVNYKKQNQVGIKIYQSSIKDSGVTGLDRTSRVSNVSSPNSGIKLIQSAYKTGDPNIKIGSISSKPRQVTYGTKTDHKNPDRSTVASQDKGVYPTDSMQSSSSQRVSRPTYGASISSNQAGQRDLASRYSTQLGNQLGQNISGYNGQQSGIAQGYTGATYANQSSLSGTFNIGGTGSSVSSSRPGTFLGTSGYQGSINTLGPSVNQGGSGSGTRYGTTPPSSYSSSQGQGR